MRILITSLLIVAGLHGQDTRSTTAPRENDRAARIARDISASVSALRGIPARAPVKINVYSVAQLEKRLTEMIAEELPPDRMLAYERGLKALGLLPADYSLSAGISELLRTQIAGFYDPATKELRLIDRSKGDGGGPQSGGMSGLFGGPGASQEEVDRIIMAHELTHALQDQRFDLSRLPMGLLDDDDLVTAVKSVPEGDATVLMMAWMMAGREPAAADALFRRAGLLRFTLRLLQRGLLGSMPGLDDVPPYLLQGMIFPYFEGMLLCLSAGRDGRGFRGVDALYGRMPLSTEQVLHPKKILGPEPDWPQDLRLPDLAPSLGKGARLVTTNTLGELYARILLEGQRASRRGARRAAAGWDGDRYVLYEHAAGETLAWLSTWDSEKEAAEMEAALARWLGGRAGSEATSIRRIGAERAEMVLRNGRDVVLLLGVTPVAASRLLPRLLTETSRTERRTLPKPEKGR